MITKAAIYTCDICKKKDIVSLEEPVTGWSDFIMEDVGLLYAKNMKPAQLCPECTQRIKQFISTMNDFPFSPSGRTPL